MRIESEMPQPKREERPWSERGFRREIGRTFNDMKDKGLINGGTIRKVKGGFGRLKDKDKEIDKLLKGLTGKPRANTTTYTKDTIAALVVGFNNYRHVGEHGFIDALKNAANYASRAYDKNNDQQVVIFDRKHK